MSLRDKLATPPAPARRPSILDVWLAGLPDDERDAADAMLRNRDRQWTHVEIRDAFIEEGAPKVGLTTLKDWRREYVSR